MRTPKLLDQILKERELDFISPFQSPTCLVREYHFRHKIGNGDYPLQQFLYEAWKRE